MMRAMRIDIADSVPLSPQETFLLIRDRMPELVPHMDGCESIVVTSRTEDGDVVRLVNRWVLSLDQVPAAAARFASKELVTWDDHANWSASTRSCSWRLQPLKDLKIFSCSGTTRIEEEGAGARLVMAIDLEIYPERVPGLPGFIARPLRPQIEQFISTRVAGSMRNLAVSIRRYAAATA